MVKRYTDTGAPYHELPYTAAEKRDFYRRIGGGPVAVVKWTPARPVPTPPPNDDGNGNAEGAA